MLNSHLVADEGDENTHMEMGNISTTLENTN